MAIYRQKTPMSLEEYRFETYEPAWRFEEDQDYIIFHDDYYSNTAILIDRDAYFTTRGNRIRYFDMLRLSYKLPFLPEEDNVKFGNFFISDYGPSFFLTEPKDAEDIMIYNGSTYYVWPSAKHNGRHAIIVAIDSWFGTIQETERFHRIINTKCQAKFEENLSRFYRG